MKIPITCRVTEYETLQRLKEFQGDLKTISRDEIEKLKRSILKYGFSFPVFIWNLNILDGHQRLVAVKELIEAGHEIDAIPIVSIEAADEKEAAEKLLLLNSRYAEIDQVGFENFITDFDIKLAEIDSIIHLPDISIINDIQIDEDDKTEEIDVSEFEFEHTCPRCGFEFN